MSIFEIGGLSLWICSKAQIYDEFPRLFDFSEHEKIFYSSVMEVLG